MDVLLARADAIIAPAVKYFEDAIEGKRGAQLARMKVARIFNPLHVKSLGSSLLATDIDALSIFRFSKHPELAPEIEAMKSELSTYLNLVKDIKPLTQRRDAKTKKDTFDLQVWWCEAASKIPSWATVLRAVLTNSPNSIPPERCFSILNDSFDDDQSRSNADYIELSIEKQYNARGRGGA